LIDKVGDRDRRVKKRVERGTIVGWQKNLEKHNAVEAPVYLKRDTENCKFTGRGVT